MNTSSEQPNRDPVPAHVQPPPAREFGANALSPEDIEEFRSIVRQETGVDMSEQEAWNRAIELIALVRMVIGPLPEDPER